MTDFFVTTGWIIRAFEAFILLYLIIKFKNHRTSLFFGGQKNLKTIDDHELHSCFISALTVMVFHFTSANLAEYILAIKGMERMELRQFYYFSMFICSVAFSAALFALHLIRGCTFSPTARQCLYVALLMCILQCTQFIARAIIGTDILSPIYKYGVVILNLMTLSIVASYPLKRLGLLVKKEV
jgi:hypothetical protein